MYFKIAFSAEKSLCALPYLYPLRVRARADAICVTVRWDTTAGKVEIPSDSSRGTWTVLSHQNPVNTALRAPGLLVNNPEYTSVKSGAILQCVVVFVMCLQ